MTGCRAVIVFFSFFDNLRTVGGCRVKFGTNIQCVFSYRRTSTAARLHEHSLCGSDVRHAAIRPAVTYDLAVIMQLNTVFRVRTQWSYLWREFNRCDKFCEKQSHRSCLYSVLLQVITVVLMNISVFWRVWLIDQQHWCCINRWQCCCIDGYLLC
jgi:hypothetical protein